LRGAGEVRTFEKDQVLESCVPASRGAVEEQLILRPQVDVHRGGAELRNGSVRAECFELERPVVPVKVNEYAHA
jgi:hypothetical protein